MKMYIAVLDEFPDYMTPTLVAHAVLGHHVLQEYNKDSSKESTLYYSWLRESFKKCVVRVTQKEFDKISVLPNVTLSHENTTLNSRLACAVLVVDDDIPTVLKFAKLWKPKD